MTITEEAQCETTKDSIDVRRAIVVGASLAGLMTALSLSRAGYFVTLLERSGDTGRTGAAINVGRGSLDQFFGGAGAEAGSPPSHGVQSWTTVHANLTGAMRADPAIRLHPHVEIVDAGQDARGAWATSSSGRVFRGDVLIGADGHRSVVRRALRPARPDASFAGYGIWLGVAHEDDIGSPRPWPRETAFIEDDDGVLLGYPLPSATGVDVPGRRQLGWAWYDARRNGLLRKTGCVVDGVVRHSLRPSDVPETLLEELADEACNRLPSPWRDAVLDSIARRGVTATPIAEYVPDALVSGRIAIVGDAAHVPTPMTGGGFGESLRDAEALADVLSRTDSCNVAAALEKYQRIRLDAVRAMVQRGQSFSSSFARD